MKSLIQFVVSWSLKCPRESYLLLFQLLLLLSQNSVLWMGHERNGALGIIWYNWGRWVLTQVLLVPTPPPLPHEKSQAKKVSLDSKLCHLAGNANMDKVKLSLLPFPMHPN